MQLFRRWPLLLTALALACTPDERAPADLTLDRDGDGLTDGAELAGYEIFVDFSGFGLARPAFLERRLVTSDPLNADTDGDGLDDGEEYLRKCDPGRVDTDNDGLSDADEVRRWNTSPVSVDTDADARDGRSEIPPDPALFDAAELNLRDVDGVLMPGLGATDPTSNDTDGDGISDRVELGNPLRSAVIAETPRVSIEQVDDVSVWLDVEYDDITGGSESFGRTQSYSSSSSETTSSSRVGEWAIEGSFSVSLGFDVSTSPGVTIGGGVSATVSGGATWSGETTRESSRAWSSARTQESSSTSGRSVGTSEGRISASVKMINDGFIAYEIRDLAIGVRMLQPDGKYRSVAALQPAAGFDSFTLAPGADSGTVFFGAAGIEANTIRQFMDRPAGLLLEPTDYKLVDSSGTSFVFVAEETYGRTTEITVDYGDGTVDTCRPASNLDRDEAGAFIGARFTDGLLVCGYDDAVFDGSDVLTSLAGRSSELWNTPAPDLGDPAYRDGTEPGARMTKALWMVVVQRHDLAEDESLAEVIDLPTLRLQARDVVSIGYLRDEDRDGLSHREEYLRGTSDRFIDSDGTVDQPEGDGLSDWFEVRSGWTVSVVGQDPYVAFSSPVLLDSDLDGCTDDVEQAAGTDPNLPDTDGDGTADCDALGQALDVDPLNPEVF